MTATEYTQLERPALRWIVEGLIPSPALIVLAGEPKAGKTFLALQMSLAVAQGRPFLGRRTIQGPVLYYQFDTSETIWRDRLAGLAAGGVDISGPLYLVHPEDQPAAVNILLPESQGLIRDTIRQIEPSLIVFDTFREMHSGKEDSATDQKRVLEVLHSLTAGYAVLLIHHTSKISNKEVVRVIDLPRGSSYLAGRADALLVLVDDTLHIVPRFADTMAAEGRRLTSGLWSFPLLEHEKEMRGLCVQYPAATHKELASKHAARFGVTPSALRALLDGQPCCHRACP